MGPAAPAGLCPEATPGKRDCPLSDSIVPIAASRVHDRPGQVLAARMYAMSMTAGIWVRPGDGAPGATDVGASMRRAAITTAPVRAGTAIEISAPATTTTVSLFIAYKRISICIKRPGVCRNCPVHPGYAQTAGASYGRCLAVVGRGLSGH